MENKTIPPLSISQRERIKRVVKFHHGIDVKDDDIDWIDKMLRNHYVVLHDQRIMSNLVTVNIDNILLKYRDKIGSLKFEKIVSEKLIFQYLTFAEMAFRAGIPICSIQLCRTAIETGLRERIAEEFAKREDHDEENLPERTWRHLEKLELRCLWELIDIADENDILGKAEVEQFFGPLKLGEQPSRKVLDKFIHGDVGWIVKFAQSQGKEFAKVIGAKDILEEKKIISVFPGGLTDKIAVATLIATTLIGERLYFSRFMRS